MTRSFAACFCGLALGALPLLSGCEAERNADTVQITSRNVVRRNNIAIDVSNVAGSVTVEVRPGSLPSVRIQPSQGLSRRRDGKSEWGWAKGVDVDGKPTLRVVAGREAQPVNVWILVPSCDSVRVRSSDGAVNLRGVSGEIDVQNDSTRVVSPVRIQAGPGRLGSLNVRTGNGDIEIRAPRGSSATLVSKTPSAATELRPGDSAVQRVRVAKGVFEATLNGGGPLWTVEAVRGRCTLDLGQQPDPTVEIAELWPF